MKKLRTLIGCGLGLALTAVLAGAVVAQDAAETPAVAAGASAVQAPAAPTPPAPPTPRQRGAGAARVAAQTPAAEPGLPEEDAAERARREAEEARQRERDELFDRSRPIVRIGQDVTVSEGTVVRDLVVVGGSATVNGRILSDAVVVGGQLSLGPTAYLDGDAVNVAGATLISSGAKIFGDLVVVAGAIDAPADFSVGGDEVVVGTRGMGNGMRAVIPWISQGLFLGRPIVPSLGWMWGLLFVVLFVYALIALFFERAVRSCMTAVTAKPLSTFMAGLLVLLLVGPALFILTVSVVGIIVIPFALAALVMAWIIGKIGVLRAVGHRLLPESAGGDDVPKVLGVRSLAIGFAVVSVAYMIPVIGALAFILVAVFGLGSAWVAMMAGWRKENPLRPKPTTPVPPPTPEPPVTLSPAYGDFAPEGPMSASASAFTSVEPPLGGSMREPSSDFRGYAAGAEGGAAAAAPRPGFDPGGLLAMPKASLGQRAAAFGIDVLLVILAHNVLLSDVLRDGPNTFFVLLLAYHVTFWAMKATTVGGIICSLRVIRTDGSSLGFPDALIRGFSSILSIVPLGIGCLWIAYDPDRQAWHDRIAGTYVVKVPKGWPL